MRQAKGQLGPQRPVSCVTRSGRLVSRTVLCPGGYRPSSRGHSPRAAHVGGWRGGVQDCAWAAAGSAAVKLAFMSRVHWKDRSRILRELGGLERSLMGAET